MAEDGEKGKRISTDQRVAMLDFMKSHPALATGKFTAPDGAKHKQRLLNELASILNSMSTGVTKSADKWMKSWQDWRSDVKSKAALLNRERNKTGGGKVDPKAKPLTSLEEQLLGFLGPSVVYGHQEVLDTLPNPNRVPHEHSTETAGMQTSESVQMQIDGMEPMQMYEFPNVDGTTEIVWMTNSVESPNLSSPVASPSSSVVSDTTKSNFSAVSSASAQRSKRQRRTSTDPTSEEETPLVKMTRMYFEQQASNHELQLKESQERNNIEREKLEVERRKASSVEAAATAFAGAMVAVEQYFRSKPSDKS